MKKILVVDDYERIWRSLKDRYSNENWEILGATSIEEALQLFKENQDQIVLITVDGCVPGHDYNTGSLIRHFRANTSVPIVAASGSDGLLDEMVEDGCTEKCPKHKLPSYITNFVKEH